MATDREMGIGLDEKLEKLHIFIFGYREKKIFEAS